MRNRVGIYYAYWTRDWNADFVPFLARAKSLGFDALEINAGTLGEMTEAEKKRLKAASEEADVPMSCCIGLPPSSDLASSNASTRRAGIAHLGGIADAMADCGIQRLTGIIYSCWPGMLEGRGVSKEEAFRWSIESMKEAIRKAEDLGLVYHVEVVNRFEQFLLNTAEEGVRYVQEVGSPSLRILLDTYHMNIEEDSFERAITTAGNLLGHFHVGEGNRKPPGRGHIPWTLIGNALKGIRFSGWIVMEPFLVPGGEVGRDIRVNREMMPRVDLDEEARRACAFTRELLTSS